MSLVNTITSMVTTNIITYKQNHDMVTKSKERKNVMAYAETRNSLY